MISTENYPINEYVVKVASNCNIDCTYCYEYNLGDESWKKFPKAMTPEVARQLAKRIREHCQTNNIDQFSMSLHGGEPLLLGAKKLDLLLNAFVQEFVGMGIEYNLSMQTNAMLMNTDIINILKKYHVLLGISIDGMEHHHNLNRIDKLGNGTYAKVINGINLLKKEAPELFNGILCVVDLRNNPIDVVDHLYSFGTNNIDLLLPLNNWDRVPHRKFTNKNEYSEYYYLIWNNWINNRWPNLDIRFLKNIIYRLAGHEGIYEEMCIKPTTLACINTAGGIEGVDTLKSSASNAQFTGLNIWDNSFDDVISTKDYIDRTKPLNSLCAECKNCDLVEICVGGYLPHRFSSEKGFDNPSVYCSDFKELIPKIKDDILNHK